MPIYGYSGVDAQGDRIKGTVSADSPRASRDQLRGRGVQVNSLSLIESSNKTSWWQALGQHRARYQWGGAAHELSLLLRAGISVDEALEILAGQYHGTFRDSLKRLHDQISAGRSLAEAMSDEPGIFDAASIRLVEVGENAGTLEVVLDELADFKQRMSEFGDKIATALMYPVFLLLFGTAAMVFLMTWVLPPLLENLQETLDEIPWPTRVAKFASETLVNHGGKLFLLASLSVAALIAFARTPNGQHWIHRTVLKLPLLGPILTKQHVARVSMIIGVLLRSGIPLSQALELASRSTQNRVIRDCLEQCGQDLTAGRNLANSLSKYDVFPPLAVRVFSVGQDSGELDEMLIRLGEDYNHQVQVASTRLTTLLEPALILFMAVMVGFLLVATILPILQAGKMV
ncbi:putative type II secretion system protein F [Planctomycetes bacterium CA13]|uniref:General secretion pathway protein F n=1 Tax=Novipirellula herctigrandis TaxID=2527986 RepID=A0A5C5Z5J3_9BACT|nr:putative type II secretion system protein F [Planctomycetes bacterium CA13]